jgi:putative Holliday junction resolvase
MRILGIDYGDRHIGLALSDPLLVTAQPLETYQLSALEAENRRFFLELKRRHGIERAVVGLPLRMDGTPGTRAETTRVFAAWLERATGWTVEFWDERLTTQQALHSAQEQNISIKHKRAAVNQIAAVIILQSYLDGRDAHEPPPTNG